MGIKTRGLEISTTLKLNTEDCANCGVTFAMPADLMLRLRREHRDFFCPNGHKQFYGGESEAERLRRELQMAQDATARAEASVRWWRDRKQTEERAHAATRGQLTKARKRIANGLCPCCKRHFVNLERHMSGQHPDYAETPS